MKVYLGELDESAPEPDGPEGNDGQDVHAGAMTGPAAGFGSEAGKA